MALLSNIFIKLNFTTFFKLDFLRNLCACSSVWIEQWGPNPKVEGSNPFGRALLDI